MTDERIEERMIACFKKAGELLEKTTPPITQVLGAKDDGSPLEVNVNQPHYTFEVTELAVSLFNAGWGL